MLGVLLLLHLADVERTFIAEALTIARSAEQNYPFALTSFEVTVSCIKEVRAGNFERSFVKELKKIEPSSKNSSIKPFQSKPKIDLC